MWEGGHLVKKSLDQAPDRFADKLHSYWLPVLPLWAGFLTSAKLLPEPVK